MFFDTSQTYFEEGIDGVVHVDCVLVKNCIIMRWTEEDDPHPVYHLPPSECELIMRLVSCWEPEGDPQVSFSILVSPFSTFHSFSTFRAIDRKTSAVLMTLNILISAARTTMMATAV